MKIYKVSAGAVVFITILVSLIFRADAQEAGGFRVERFVIAGSVDNREPVGIVNAFSAFTEQVYCFLEAQDIQEDTSVTFVWFYEGKEAARVVLPLRKGSKWRTYSSKNLGGRKGSWRVELWRSDGSVLQEVSFSVE